MKSLAITLLFSIFLGCVYGCDPDKKSLPDPPQTISGPSLLILGTIQDGGSPHIACKKECCRKLFSEPDPKRKVVSLGVIDPENKMYWLFEATPDLPFQMKSLKNHATFVHDEAPDGIFLTHAHIGHYSGLIYLGREAMNSKNIPLYAMPRMKSFLENNGPWSQLLSLNNINIQALEEDHAKILSSNIKVTAFRVPHRDEFSETVGFLIEGPRKKILFIPDIDKWNKWDKNIVEEIKKVDLAFIDGTFYDASEVPGRNLSEIPHPFVTESMEFFKSLADAEKKKIHFIHFNHTNPLLNDKSKATAEVLQNNFHLAKSGEIFGL